MSWGYAMHCGTPLVSTMRFRGAEFFCVKCEAKLGFLDPTGKKPESDKEDAALKAEYEANRATFEQMFRGDQQ